MLKHIRNKLRVNNSIYYKRNVINATIIQAKMAAII